MAIDIKGITDILMGKDPSKRKHVFKKERREIGFSAGALVIVHTTSVDTFNHFGRGYKKPLAWSLAEVIKSVTFTEGLGGSTPVELTILEIPPFKKGITHIDEIEEWQANDVWYIPIPKEGEPAFRDYHMMMRLSLSSPKTQCPWLRYPVTTVTADLVQDATRLSWLKLAMTR